MAENQRNKIRVGIFVEGRFLPSFDGATNRFHYLSRFLQLSGKVDVVIFHCHREWSDISLIKKEPFQTYLLSPYVYYNNLELISTLIQKENISILQFNDFEPILYQGTNLSRLTNCKIINEVHYDIGAISMALGMNNSYKKIKSIEKKITKNIDHTILLSKDDKPGIQKRLKIKERNLSIIPSGIDSDEIKYNVPKIKNKRIVFLGNLFFQPNEDAVRTIKNKIYPKIVKEGYSFLIAGEYPTKLREELEETHFKFTGPYTNLNNFFKQASICIAPIFEGTGMRIKFLNFLAAGIPILTTSIATQGFPNKNYFLIENNVERYGERIVNLFNNPQKILKISRDGREYVKEKFRWENISLDVARIYKKVSLQKPKSKNVIEKKSKKLPLWLTEAINKGRYRRAPSKMSENFSYIEIKKKGVQKFIVQEIIALEGMPGAGKSTYIKHLKKYKRVGTLNQLIVKHKMVQNGYFKQSKKFLLAEANKLKRVERLSKTFEKIILDRSFLSTLAYCYAKSKIYNDKNYQRLLIFYSKIKKTGSHANKNNFFEM